MMNKVPNVLWIILDDSSQDMFGFAGGPVPTPNIDRLAYEGVFCTSFHTASPICTPSRYRYLTFDSEQLYNLETDPGEKVNLAENPEHHGICQEMQARLTGYLSSLPHPCPEQADPFLKSATFWSLCENSRRDTSFHEPEWYRNHGG